MDCTIRTMRAHELEFAVESAAAEGWNPGLHDAASFYAADPDGFLLALYDGQAIGCIGAVSYAGRFGFIGLYIVAPAWRGRGIGGRLWRAGTDRLGGHVVGLDGVPAQQAYYRRQGFALAWQNARYAGTARAAPARALAQIVPLREVDFAALCADDRRSFPAPREAFLRSWVAQPDATGLAWVEGERLRGWGLIRRCRIGHKIAPLVADEPSIADALYDALVATVPSGDPVYLDVPLPNTDAQALARARGLAAVFETARMYAGPAPTIELARVYGVTSFELG
jgi:ribosomal protein S18 acetylase RimI-like enzyme